MIYLLLYLPGSLALASVIGHALRARDEDERKDDTLDRLNNSHW